MQVLTAREVDMKKREKQMKAAARSLQKILEDVEPFTKRPVVEEPTTRGRWVSGEDYGVGAKLRSLKEAKADSTYVD